MTSLRERLRAALPNLLLLAVSLGGSLVLAEVAIRALDLFSETRSITYPGRDAGRDDGDLGLAGMDDGAEPDEASPAAGRDSDDPDSGDPGSNNSNAGNSNADSANSDTPDSASADDGPVIDGVDAAPPRDRYAHLGRRSDRMLIHPFLGWVHRPGDRDARGKIWRVPSNKFGLRSLVDDYRDFEPDDFVVGLFGGSVARGVAISGERMLVKRLEALRPELAGKVRVANLGTGGYKQPQQLFLFSQMLLLGVPFDAVISLDGFNEVALGTESTRRGFHPVFPHRSFWEAAVSLGSGRLTDEQIEGTAEILQLRRRADGLRAWIGQSIWGASALARTVVGVSIQRSESAAALVEKRVREATRPEEDDPYVNLDAPCLGEDSSCFELIADLWEQASLQMDALARQQGIPYIHALQPSQYVEGSKVLTNNERRRAYDPKAAWSRSAIEGYPLLQATGESLRQQGVDFHDLTPVFRDHPQDLYRDRCCHFNAEGSRIVAARLAELVDAALSQTDPSAEDVDSLN